MSASSSEKEISVGLRFGFALVGITAAVMVTLLILSRFNTPPVDTVQRGFRGTAMAEIYSPADIRKYVAENKVPASLPQLPAVGPKAGAVYKNVQVLGSLSVGQFTRLMVSITNWVAPTQGCAYCHNTANMADDGIYTKVVARPHDPDGPAHQCGLQAARRDHRSDLLHLPSRQPSALPGLVQRPRCGTSRRHGGDGDRKEYRRRLGG